MKDSETNCLSKMLKKKNTIKNLPQKEVGKIYHEKGHWKNKQSKMPFKIGQEKFLINNKKLYIKKIYNID